MASLFHDELNYLRESGKEFSRLNPKLSKYLSESSTDPDVERLLEGFAFLTSRVREKIEDDLPELTHSLVQLLWPNFLRPFPPTCLMQFRPVRGTITEAHVIPRGMAMRARPIEGGSCDFRTTADCLVYPVELTDVAHTRTQDRSQLALSFAMLSERTVGSVNFSDLRLWFTGDAIVAQTLYLWCLRYLLALHFTTPDGRRVRLPNTSVRAGGFASDETLLPSASTAFDAYRLLQEFFVFPDKFHCVDFDGLAAAAAGSEAKEFGLDLEFERPLPAPVKLRAGNVRLFCSPAVNLFETDAEPIAVDHRKVQYRVKPSGNDCAACEIFSIDNVVGFRASEKDRRFQIERAYPAFESFHHEVEMASRREQVYYRQRLTAAATEAGFEHAITFVLHDGEQAVPAEEAMSIRLTCFNRTRAAELAIGDIDLATDSSPSFIEFSNITRPTAPVYPPIDGALNWNLISNLSLNYMSLLDKDALGVILQIYDYRSLTDRQAERAARLRLGGIRNLSTRPADMLFKGRPIRGIRSILTLDETCFQSEGEMYLFGSILKEFIAISTTTNSFHELELRGENNGEIYRWPATIGRQPLI